MTLGTIAILGIYGAMGLVSFVAMGIDKRRAARGQWRIPEKTLHLLELLGGIFGSLLAQMVFRHKTRKFSYQALFWVILLGHAAGWIWFYRTFIG